MGKLDPQPELPLRGSEGGASGRGLLATAHRVGMVRDLSLQYQGWEKSWAKWILSFRSSEARLA